MLAGGNISFINPMEILTLLFMVLLNFDLFCQNNMDFDRERRNMIKYQIENRGINDEKVLKAFEKVERHKFVPEEYKDNAYEDRPLPIGWGQTISQPYIVAFMTDILELTPEDRILEIGTGSGYQAAILAQLCDSVFTIEIVEPLGKRAKETLKSVGYDNVYVKIGDGFKGWPEKSPFDAIIVTCAPEDIPEPLQNQLAEGGRMIIPVGDYGRQEMILMRKIKGKIKKEAVLDVAFVPMVDEKGKRY
jgi:protein-L-isoaspartate(D-aspartate) O-methyltransferase